MHSPDTEASPSPTGQKEEALKRCALSELALYFLKLGITGFGGPVALVGYMQRDLVEARRWISREDYLEGLALAQLAPGPLAAQLAIYIGWVRAGIPGATLIGVAFILPSFLMVVAISEAYIHYGGLPWIQGLFYGIGAAVIAVIVRSAFKLTRFTLGRDLLLWAIFTASALITALTESEIVWVFLLGGIIPLVIRSRFFKSAVVLSAAPVAVFLVTGLKGPADAGVLWKIGLYFTEAGAFVFGSGLAIVPFLYGGVVRDFHWLNDSQFLDAVAVAMITPGPVVITVAFIGYMAAGPLGGTIAALGVFLPCYLFVVIPAKYFHRFAKNTSVKAFVDGVTSAATGAIGGAAFVLGRRAITDIPTSVIAITTLALLLKVKKVPEPLIIVAAGMAGVILKS